MSESVYRQFDRNSQKCKYVDDFVMFVHPLIARDSNSRDRWTHPKTDTSHPVPSYYSPLRPETSSHPHATEVNIRVEAKRPTRIICLI